MPINRINVYTCPRGHLTVTVDRDEGTTPFMMSCSEGGHPCLQPAQSSLYRVDQALAPTHEWYKPTLKEAKRKDRRARGTLDHVQRGGLLLRRITPAKALPT